MKGLEPRVCDPTAAFPALEASTLYHDAFPVHAASEESIAEFERVLHTIAADQSTNIGGLDRERWLKGAVAIDRCGSSSLANAWGRGLYTDHAWPLGSART